jgi:hypothetical protein
MEGGHMISFGMFEGNFIGIGSVKVQYRESYLGPPSNTGAKHEVTCGKVAEITPPKLDQS